MDNTFLVKQGEFEGPLDLLLSLIEERKMLISDVSLSKVADDFVAYIKDHEHFPAGQAAHFILVAATLLLIKSRSLIPMLSLSDEEEQDIDELERRLALYKVFREAGAALGRLRLGRLYFGGLARDREPVFAPAPDMTPDALHAAANTALERVPKKESKPEVAVQSTVSLEDMMGRLAERIERALSITFKDFVGDPEDRREIVVGFLAVLELMKRGHLLAEQAAHGGDIVMSYQGAAQPPKYD